MSTLVMNDATTKTILLASQSGFNSLYRDVASTSAVKLEANAKATLAGSDAFSQQRSMLGVVRKRTDALVSKEAVVGCNLTVYKSNHSLITQNDVYDVIWALMSKITGISTAMTAGQKLMIDQWMAGVSIF